MLEIIWITVIFVFFLIIMTPLVLLLKFILRKVMQASNKIMKTLIIVFTIIVGPIVLVGVIIATLVVYFSIIYPSTTIQINKPISSEVVSAKQIVEYLNNEILQIDNYAKYDWKVGKIVMILDIEHRGKVTVRFLEKEKGQVMFAYLDTRKKMFYKLSNHTEESNRYPRTINFQDWKIDSPDAVSISKDFLNTGKGFRYDEIQLIADYSYKEGKEIWEVYLTDRKSDLRYYLGIDPYLGAPSAVRNGKMSQ
ncbi:MAG: hypothetical protein LBU89_04155 [Fibromonadaceae bacterium]|jgi:hypothetical protein|nr:hypothetical protein [Fibromonadaceae bacterium]